MKYVEKRVGFVSLKAGELLGNFVKSGILTEGFQLVLKNILLSNSYLYDCMIIEKLLKWIKANHNTNFTC